MFRSNGNVKLTIQRSVILTEAGKESDDVALFEGVFFDFEVRFSY